MMSRRRQSRYNCRRGGAPSSSMAGGGLPANAIEWVRSIGLGQYAERMRHAGLVRLELAARIGEAECARLQMTPAHKTKLLASARRLGERLQQRGRAVPGSHGGGGGGGKGEEEVYAAAAQIHYDAETGECFDEAGMMDMEDAHAEGGGASGGGQGAGAVLGGVGSGGRGRPIDPALQRRRNEASKARIANHSRKQGAARKQARSGGFVP